MAINIQCKTCGKLYRLKDSMAGKKARCKVCGAILEIPTLEEVALKPAKSIPAPPASEPLKKPPSPAEVPPKTPEESARERLPVLEEWPSEEKVEEAPSPRISLAPAQGAPTSGLATASMVLGILGITVLGILCGIPAIILGVIARGQIKKSKGALGGGRKATAGIVLGIISIFLTMLIIAGYFVLTGFVLQKGVPEEMPEIDMSRPVDAVKKSASRGVLTMVGHVIIMYAMMKDEKLPDSLEQLVAGGFLDEKFTYMPKASGRPSRYKYVYLGKGRKITDYQGTIVAHGRPEAFDGEGCYVLFIDGQVKWMTPEELNEARKKQAIRPMKLKRPRPNSPLWNKGKSCPTEMAHPAQNKS